MDDACLVDGNNHSWGINLPDGIKNTAVYGWSRNCRIVFDEKNFKGVYRCILVVCSCYSGRKCNSALV